jgi:hypothetical protein
MQRTPRPRRRARLLEQIARALVAGVALQLLSGTARADASETTAEAQLWAARACYVESSWRAADCIAILWVARKRATRAQRPWLDMLQDYSAVKANTPRAREARTFPWGDVPHMSRSFNRQWLKLRKLVVEFAEGRHVDPCPRAQHWGGTMDLAQGRMVPARCAVATANTFYALQRRPR